MKLRKKTSKKHEEKLFTKPSPGSIQTSTRHTFWMKDIFKIGCGEVFQCQKATLDSTISCL